MRCFPVIPLLFVCQFPLANAAINVQPLAQVIQERACQTALLGTGPDVVVVVGLGNHGFHGTRHNVGTDLVEQLAQTIGSVDHELPEHWTTYQAKDESDAEAYMEFTAASSPRREGLTIHYRVGGKYSVPPVASSKNKIIFVHPYYDINESGHLVAALAREAKLFPEQIIVIIDDLTLARNQIVLSVGKVDGSGDGHNGLKSINAQFGTGSYFRIRVGVSNPKSEKLEVTRHDWVLGQMTEEDRAALFAKGKLENLVSLILNLQSRRQLDAKTVQKVVGQGAEILKKLNQK